jgi:transketolase
MRGTFARTLTEMAVADRRVLLLTADLGFMALEPFSSGAPAQFLNVGVAEQNMIGVGTGLAEGGYLPYCYSISTFASLRPYEFIRDGPVLHHLPVRIVGMGAGFEYGTAGATHHGIDDAAALRPQPGLTIISPADYLQTRKALLDTWNHPGPIYFRLGKDDTKSVPGLDGRFRLGGAEIIRDGKDLLFITMGAIAFDVVEAAERLSSSLGLESTIAIVSSFNPSPIADLSDQVRQFSHVISVEAHRIDGGIGSLVAESIAESGSGSRLLRCGVRGSMDGRSGSQRFFNERFGLSPERLAAAAETFLRG